MAYLPLTVRVTPFGSCSKLQDPSKESGWTGGWTDLQMDAVVPWQKTPSPHLLQSTSVLPLLWSVCWRFVLSAWWFPLIFFFPCFWECIFSSLGLCLSAKWHIIASLRDQALGELLSLDHVTLFWPEVKFCQVSTKICIWNSAAS